jgi:hypothetical protein
MRELKKEWLIAVLICPLLIFSCNNYKENRSYLICNWKIKTSENNSINFKIDTIYDGLLQVSQDIKLSKASIDSLLKDKSTEINQFFINGYTFKLNSYVKVPFSKKIVVVYKLFFSRGTNFEEDNSNTLLFTNEFGFIFIRLNKGLHDYQTFELEDISVKNNNIYTSYNLKNLFQELFKDTLLFPLPPKPHIDTVP